jgi:5'-nucleotidase
MRIMVTNDDGIDSIGLHVLARSMREHGDVVIVAPDSEYSGAGAALGPLHLIKPDVHKRHIDGIDESWSVEGAPGLCAMFGRMGAFGPIGLVVSGINPGANVGRAVYHSGTIGACITARNGGVSGVAVSQSVANFGVEGQAWDDLLADQMWETAATVASNAVGQLIASPPEEPYVLNLNVPNVPLDEIKGWRYTDVAMLPPRTVGSVKLVPRPGHEEAFTVEMEWGDTLELPADTDSGAIMADYVTASWLSRLTHVPTSHPEMEAGFDELLG